MLGIFSNIFRQNSTFGQNPSLCLQKIQSEVHLARYIFKFPRILSIRGILFELEGKTAI